ncbi:MAG: YbaB/EbfC family nucleoid-associated protein [Bacilli bacterium]
MNFDVQKMMQDAKKLQKEMMDKKNTIDVSLFKSENQAVLLEVNGKRELIKFELKDVFKELDKDLLEDMILLAFKDVTAQVYKKYEEEMGEFSDLADFV